MLRRILLLSALALPGCGEKITAPEAVAFIARWDSSRIKLAEDGLAMTWAPVNGWDNLPDPGTISVQLDGQQVLYRAIVLELRKTHSRFEARGCPPQHYVALLLWREAPMDPGLDVIAAHIGGRSGVMEGPVQKMQHSFECGLAPSAGVAAYFNRHFGGSYGRVAATGSFRASRNGNPRTCDFVEKPEELAHYGASCAMQRFDVDLDAGFPPDTVGRGIAGGASQVRVSYRGLPGAVFTLDCASTTWSRDLCG